MGAFLNQEQEEMGRFGLLDPEDEDLQTVESFVSACMEEGVTTFNWQHLAVLSWNLGRFRPGIRTELESYGLRFEERPNVRRIRTSGDNPHDRWHGLGASPTHGGSGWEQVTGFAGREG